MKKHIILLFLTLSLINAGNAQDTTEKFKFDTKYFDAVDQYVTLPIKEQDSTYSIYFIYIDEMAGFSMKYQNDITVKENGELKLIPNKELQTTIITTRLGKNTRPLAVLSKDQIKELQLSKQPEWLNIYKPKEAFNVSYLTKIGYFYNHVGASHNAIEPLLKAYKKEPYYKGLSFELGFAYNATKQFKNAIPVLEKAISKDKKNQLLYKELGYALVNSKQIDKAEKVYEKGISISKDNAIKCEMAVNMANLFFIEKNKKRFDKWAKITRKYGDKTPQFIKYIDYFEAEFKKDK